MKINQVRHATIVIESGDYKIVVDPFLAQKGTMPSLQIPKALFRKTNPLVELPRFTSEVMNEVTHALITHNHFDHIDDTGVTFLKEKEIPVYCSEIDEKAFRRKGLIIAGVISAKGKSPFLNGTIRSVANDHGRGWIRKIMGKGVGYIVKLPNEPSLYLTGDTVWTETVKQTIKQEKPEVSVVAAGGAKFLGLPILMSLQEIEEFIQLSSGNVLLNHLEVYDHCATTKMELKLMVKKEGWEENVLIPEDGDTISYVSLPASCW